MRKFDIKILQICPPHLSDVATLPWEIQKSCLEQVIDEVDKYVRFSCQIFSGFDTPKIIKIG